MTSTRPPVITVDQLIEQIKVGPGGPKVAAFFDFDGTLIQGYSAGALYAHRARNLELGPDEFVRTLRAALSGPLDEAAFEDLLVQGIRGWVGRTEDDLMGLGEQLFAQGIAGALFHRAWRLVRAHQIRGHTVVIATSATRMQAQPMARELGIDHVLCTELETEQGVLTGGLVGHTLWGEGKAAAVKEFARRQRLSLKNSHAYANGDEDVALLDAVGSRIPSTRRRFWPVTPQSADGTSCGSGPSAADCIRWRWPGRRPCSAASPPRWERAWSPGR